MGLWTFILLVVTVCVAGESFKSWLKYRERERRDQGKPGAGQELERLRQRIEALETIVTDGGYDLRREIDRLDASGDAHDARYAAASPASGPSRRSAASG